VTTGRPDQYSVYDVNTQQIAGQLGVYRQSNGAILLINSKYIGSDGRGAPNDALVCAPWFRRVLQSDPGAVGNLHAMRSTSAFFDWDLGILKSFPISESKRLEYRVEMFNARIIRHLRWVTLLRVRDNWRRSVGHVHQRPNFGVATSTLHSRVIQMDCASYFRQRV